MVTDSAAADNRAGWNRIPETVPGTLIFAARKPERP